MNPDESRVDQALLGQAQKVLGTASARDTLELALSVAIKQASRAQAVAGELARFHAGRYSGLPARPRAGAPAEPVQGALPGLPTVSVLPAPAAGCLIDTSALAQSARPDVAAALHSLLAASAAVTCAVLDLEVLATAASADEYDELARARRLAYRSVPLTAGVGARMLGLGELLARQAHRGALTPADLLVAATAMEHGLRLVHHSPAFALLGELTTLDHLQLADESGDTGLRRPR